MENYVALPRRVKAAEVLAETQKGEEQQAGSTATVVLARRDKLVVANVGDSRAVLCRNGQPQDLSTEHRHNYCPTSISQFSSNCGTSGKGCWFEQEGASPSGISQTGIACRHS